MLEFSVGMALGEIAMRGDLYGRMPTYFGWILLIGGLALLIMPPPWLDILPRAVSRGPFATAVVAGVLIIEANKPFREVPLFHAIGNASYSIYLTQIIVTSALTQGWRHLSLHQGAFGLVLFAIVAIVFCAVSGWLCYRLVETPLTKLFRPGGRDGAKMRAPVATQADVP